MPELTTKEIKGRILDAIIHTAPEALRTIPGKLEGYIELLSERMMACCDERGEVFRCDSCMEVGVLLRMTRAAVEKYSKQ